MVRASVYQRPLASHIHACLGISGLLVLAALVCRFDHNVSTPCMSPELSHCQLSYLLHVTGVISLPKAYLQQPCDSFLPDMPSVQVPFMFKYAVDILTADPTGATAASTPLVAVMPATLLIGYGAARAGSALFNELRNAVFAKAGFCCSPCRAAK